MCIAQLLFILIAVLYLTALSICQEEVDNMNRSSNKRFNSESLDLSSSQEANSNRLVNNREVQMLLNSGSLHEGFECCPTITEMVEPHGGKNQNGMFVDLYRDGSNRQRFYEHSCHPDYVDKPCLFTERRFRNQSRCEQKFSYTYALVRDTMNVSKSDNTDQYSSNKHRHGHKFNPFLQNQFEHSGSSWTLDYIRVRSGCSCVVYPKQKKKRTRKKNKKFKVDDGASGGVI